MSTPSFPTPGRIRMRLPTSSPLLLALVISVSILAGCGSDSSVRPDPTLNDLVGDWTAESMILTAVADPGTSVDVIEQGADFFLNIQPSGGYTSSLAFMGQTQTELGEVELEGDRLIFHVQVAPTGPRTDTARVTLSGQRLLLEGEALFDFDLDGIGEAAELDATLIKE